MFLQVVVPEWDRQTRAERGLFRAANAAARSAEGVPGWVRAELRCEFVWFNDRLPVPGRLGRRAGRHGPVWGVCWFQPEAREAINHARDVGWRLGELDYPVRDIRSARPGEIIWRDPMQIVTKPPRDHPRVVP